MQKPLVQAAKGIKTDRIPAWFLRQAGRYLPEYRKIRSKFEFLEVCKNPALAAEVTLQPLRRYDLDAAIIFSDILVMPEAMGQRLSFDKGHGPVLSGPIRNARDLNRLSQKDLEDKLSYVGEAIKRTKKQLKDGQAMIGFAGAPITVASYMIEGGASKSHHNVKAMAWNEPETLGALQNILAEATINYCNMQVDAGADVIMLFDTWAGLFGAADYQNLVWPYIKKIAAGIKANSSTPVIYYPGQSAATLQSLEPIDQIDVLAIDWRHDLKNSISLLSKNGWNVTVQGNLDPTTLLGSKQMIQARTKQIVEAGQSARAHIFNVGHGLIPQVPPKSLEWVIEQLRTS